MGVFKEEAHTFENVARKQVQIWNDAADYGYPYNTANPTPEITRLINSVHELKEYKTLFRKREQWENGVKVTIRIAWELDEGFYHGTQYAFSFNKTPKHPSLIRKDCDAFICVEIEPYSEKA